MYKHKIIILLCCLLTSILPLTLFFCSTSARLIAADDSPDNWEVTISGIDKIVYVIGDVIPIKINVFTHNPANCPNCLQQILIGIVDINYKSFQVQCVLNAKAGVFPSGLGTNKDINLTMPSVEGIVTISAARDFKNNCDEAQKTFPNQPQIKRIKQIMIVPKSANASSTPKNLLPIVSSFAASPNPIKKGEGTRLNWEVLNATEVLVSPQPGRAGYKGGFSIRPNESTIYTIAAKNTYGYTISTTTINVEGEVIPNSKNSSNSDTPKTSTPSTSSEEVLQSTPNWIQGFINSVLTILLPLAILIILGIIIWKIINSRTGKNEGYIYLMRNSKYKKDLYKIGKSQNPDERAKQIGSTTGVAGQFEVLFRLKVHDTNLAESRVHAELEPYRVQNNREFFEGPIDTFIDIIKKHKN